MINKTLIQDVRKIAELRRKVTPGPWYVGYEDGSGETSIVARDHEDALGLDATVVWGGDYEGVEFGVRKPENASFIVSTSNLDWDDLASALEPYDAATLAPLLHRITTGCLPTDDPYCAHCNQIAYILAAKLRGEGKYG